MKRAQICWFLYIAGIVLIVCSWIKVVSPQIGWAGWVVGMLGWVLWPRRNVVPSFPAPEPGADRIPTPPVFESTEPADEVSSEGPTTP